MRSPAAALVRLALLTTLAPTLAQATPPRHDRLPTGKLQLSPSRAHDRLPNHVDTPSGRVQRPTDQGALQDLSQAAPKLTFDDRTEREGQLDYGVVFNPSIAPFKRNYCYDHVDPTGKLLLATETLPATAVGGPDRLNHELFWGVLTTSVRRGEWIPLPSVSPSSRLVALTTSPTTKVQLRRDRAGIWSLSATKTVAKLTVRFLMDAPSRYFGAEISQSPTRRDPWRPTLAAPLQREISSLHSLMGVNPSQSRREQLRRLTRWFRSFQPGGAASGRSLSDVIRQRQGVCRHRTHGFVVLAHSLGVPARYVGNEAHAFVEVWVRFQSGEEGWLRVDLGGGAERLHLRTSGRRRLHRALHADTLPKPETYQRERGAGVGRMAGARHVTTEQPLTPSAQAQRPTVSRRPPRVLTWMEQRARTLAGQSTKLLADARAISTLRLRGAAKAWRTEGLTVSGRLKGPKGAVAKQTVEIWLISPSAPTTGLLLGKLPTAADGKFKGKLPLPARAHLGAWDVVAYFAGSPQLAASYSREPGQDTR